MRIEIETKTGYRVEVPGVHELGFAKTSEGIQLTNIRTSGLSDAWSIIKSVENGNDICDIQITEEQEEESGTVSSHPRNIYYNPADYGLAIYGLAGDESTEWDGTSHMSVIESHMFVVWQDLIDGGLFYYATCTGDPGCFNGVSRTDLSKGSVDVVQNALVAWDYASHPRKTHESAVALHRALAKHAYSCQLLVTKS